MISVASCSAGPSPSSASSTSASSTPSSRAHRIKVDTFWPTSSRRIAAAPSASPTAVAAARWAATIRSTTAPTGSGPSPASSSCASSTPAARPRFLSAERFKPRSSVRSSSSAARIGAVVLSATVCAGGRALLTQHRRMWALASEYGRVTRISHCYPLPRATRSPRCDCALIEPGQCAGSAERVERGARGGAGILLWSSFS